MTMDISGFLDFVDNLLSQTTYSTELLVGIGLLALMFFFVSAREFHYRYLKIHKVRKEIRELSHEISDLKTQIMDLKKSSQSSIQTKDLDFIEEQPLATKPRSSSAPKFPLS